MGMPVFQRDDVVALVRGCKGLPVGSRGIVLRNEVRGTDAPAVIVRWEASLDGPSTRGHRESSLEKYSEYEAKAKAAALAPSEGYGRKLALLGVDLETATGVGAAVALSHNLRELSATADRLRALQKAVKNVALYKSDSLNLYLVIQGKDIQLVKEVDGIVEGTLSVPLSVFISLVGDRVTL